MIKADPVVGIQQRELALYLMGLDHPLENIANGQGLPLTCQVIGHSKDCAEVVRRVTPFCREPTIVEVKPADLSANVEGSADRVDLEVGTRDLCSCILREQLENQCAKHVRTIRYNRALNDWAHQACTSLKPQALQATTNSVN